VQCRVKVNMNNTGVQWLQKLYRNTGVHELFSGAMGARLVQRYRGTDT